MQRRSRIKAREENSGGGALDQTSRGLSLPAAPHQPLHELAARRRGRAVLLVLAAAVVAAGEEQLLLQLRHLVARLLQLLVQLAPAKNVQGVRRGRYSAGTKTIWFRILVLNFKSVLGIRCFRTSRILPLSHKGTDRLK